MKKSIRNKILIIFFTLVVVGILGPWEKTTAIEPASEPKGTCWYHVRDGSGQNGPSEKIEQYTDRGCTGYVDSMNLLRVEQTDPYYVRERWVPYGEGTNPDPGKNCGASEELKNGECVSKCGASQVWEGGKCVDKPAPRNTTYTLLAPLPCPPGSLNCDANGQLTTYNVGDDNMLTRHLNTMLTIFIGICAVLAMIMIVIGGLEYMTSELVSNKEGGKEKITNAVFGLLLAVGAWVILNTINPDLLKFDLGKSVKTVEVSVAFDDSVPQTPVNGKYGNYAVKAPWDDTVAVNTNIPSWASVKQPPCTYVGQPNCTSVRGLTGEYLNIIHSKCPNCEIIITEGTAFWKHGGKTGRTSHRVGSPTVDLRVTATLTEYIMGGKTPPVKNGWYSRDGVDYLFEGDHWHAERN